MRIIELSPIKSDADIERTKQLKWIPKEVLKKMVDDKKETKIITPNTKLKSLSNHKKNQALVTEMVLKVLNENNYPLTKSIVEGLNEPLDLLEEYNGEQFQLNSSYNILMDFLHVIKLQENKSKTEKLYERLYKKVGFEVGNAKIETKNAFKNLEFNPNWTLKNLRDNLSELAKLGLLATNNTFQRINNIEIGEGNKGDQLERKDCKPTPNPIGLISTNNWNLKPHITSVKNQRSKRGTCSAFATVAAVESAVSAKYRKKMNLSEQDLYKKQNYDWNPNIFDDFYGDGGSPILSLTFQMLNKYVYPFEKSWEYNPSTKRQENDEDRIYTHSCDLYEDDCSNTNHQAKKRCYKILNTDLVEVVNEVCEYVEGIPILGFFAGWVCDFVTEVIEVVEEIQVCIYDTEIPPTSRMKISDFDHAWDPIFFTDFDTAKLLLVHNNPIIYCFTSPKSFKKFNRREGQGYISYDENEKPPKKATGHCVAIVGFVENEDLPRGVDHGEGGGYFIIKNSWGKCYGDMGFAYAPYDWVKKWGTIMTAISNVERV